MKTSEQRVFIAGAGPVGLAAAANLVRQGVPVTVFEAGGALGVGSRASTFHASTLDLLESLDITAPLVARGLVTPRVQYRTPRGGVFAEFDFGLIADRTRHPYRLQVDQSCLTALLLERLAGHPLFEMVFDRRVVGVRQEGEAVHVRLCGAGVLEERSAAWLIGADGAHSEVRRALGIGFEGFTWPERFLVLNTAFPFEALFPDLASVSYFTAPGKWFFLLRVPGYWRAMFPVPREIDDEEAEGEAYARMRLAGVAPACAGATIVHDTLYRVHQRVARSFRTGRVFLAGDAAHVNNPLGGMGMNGGIHDAFDLTDRLGPVWRGELSEQALDGYERARRGVTLEVVQQQTIRNKRNLEAPDAESHRLFVEDMRAIAADPDRQRSFLIQASMIGSLERARSLAADEDHAAAIRPAAPATLVAPASRATAPAPH